jgi:hypothetical protein
LLRARSRTFSQAGKRSPDHGRACCAQFMSGIGIPLFTYILFFMKGSSQVRPPETRLAPRQR